MSNAFEDALGIDPDAKPAEGEEEEPKGEEEPKKLKMHEHKDEFKDYAAEQKRLAGGA